MTNPIFTINRKNGKAQYFATKKEAAAMGNSFLVVTSADDIENDRNFSSSELVELYNSFRTTKDVKKFSDRKTAARRIYKVLCDLAEGMTPNPAEAEEAAKAPAKKKVQSDKKGKRDIPLKINTHHEMPFRENTQSGDTWKLIVANPGLTFNEYVAKGGRANTIAFALRNEWLVKEES